MEAEGDRRVETRVVGDCDVELWGLRSDERIRRQLAAVDVDTEVRCVSSTGTDPSNHSTTGPDVASVLMFRSDHLFDKRVIRDLAATPGVLLVADADRADALPLAAHVDVADADRVMRALAVADGERAPNGRADLTDARATGLRVETPETLSGDYVPELLKSEPVVVARMDESSRADLERYLFDGSYKGVTDLVTKFVWPRPARAVTGFCARMGIPPNAVTALSVILVVVATTAFAHAEYAVGLAAGWFMTFLDTVDGKLARVTVHSTEFGHALDHGLDLIHPPFWYIAWGLGLAVYGTPLVELQTVLWVILLGYVGGRLCEGAFTYWLADFSMFTWRPVDSYFRLVLARRNPNLILLTLGALVARPDLGLLAVAIWTVVSVGFLMARLGMAAAKGRTAPLRPWLAEGDHVAAGTPFSMGVDPVALRAGAGRSAAGGM